MLRQGAAQQKLRIWTYLSSRCFHTSPYFIPDLISSHCPLGEGVGGVGTAHCIFLPVTEVKAYTPPAVLYRE